MRTYDVKKFISDMVAMSPDQQALMRQELNSIPVPDREDAPMFCDTLQARLLVPCGLTACPYNINNEAHLNCLRHFKLASKKKPTQSDIASVLGMTTEAMKDVLATALAKMRKATLLEHMQETGVNRFSYILNTKICVACNTPIDATSMENHENVTDYGSFYYCSRQCEARRHPSQIRLEIEYEADIGDILVTARKLFHKLDAIQAVLSVRKTTLLQWYDTLLGVRPHEFGAEAAAAVDILRKNTRVAAEDSFVSILTVPKTYKRWINYDSEIQAAICSI